MSPRGTAPDRYGRDVLASNPHAPRRTQVPEVLAELGLVVECAWTGFCGAVVGWEKSSVGRLVILEDRFGQRRHFAMLRAAFLIEGRTVTLLRPTPTTPTPARTPSGSVAVTGQQARVARDSRIWVEGVHDAELVERVWGHDLRVEGVVVEPMHGIDDLNDRIQDFAPSPTRRLGILVDHLVPGSKETRIANEISGCWSEAVLVVGHPYVDVWQSIRPTVLGIAAWPVVPKGTPWKIGILQALGRPAVTDADVGAGWKWLLGHVNSYSDLEPTLSGRVEHLIDHVCDLVLD